MHVYFCLCSVTSATLASPPRPAPQCDCHLAALLVAGSSVPYKYCRTCICIAPALRGLLCPGTFVEARRLCASVRNVLQFIVCFYISSTASIAAPPSCSRSPPVKRHTLSSHYQHKALLCVSWAIFRQVFSSVQRKVTQAKPGPLAAMIIYHGRAEFCLPW